MKKSNMRTVLACVVAIIVICFAGVMIYCYRVNAESEFVAPTAEDVVEEYVFNNYDAFALDWSNIEIQCGQCIDDSRYYYYYIFRTTDNGGRELVETGDINLEYYMNEYFG